LGLRGTRLQGIGEKYITKSLKSVRLTQYCSGDKIEKNEMGEGVVARVGPRRVLYSVLVERPDGKMGIT
jgi:hypothetical protein